MPYDPMLEDDDPITQAIYDAEMHAIRANEADLDGAGGEAVAVLAQLAQAWAGIATARAAAKAVGIEPGRYTLDLEEIR